MSEAQSGFPGRGEAAAPHGPDGGAGSVHQVVFRWEGNHGRQGTGMNAVARSCTAERAGELGRELGPLLWVSGAAASRPSTVRTLSRDGDVMLVRRWPTTDPGGRPSTVSHVLVGDPGTLKTRQCLALAYGDWGTRQEAAETVSGRQRPVDCAHLDRLARARLPQMLERLPTVRETLTVVAAEWLRDPAQRVSLLAEPGEHRPGRPDGDEAALVYLGLFLLFGAWLGREWTFATYDVVDTHPLRLMCVPRWESDTGGAGPLARVSGLPVSGPRFEHRAADLLVDHLLAHPEAPAGVPHLVRAFPDGAALDWTRRRERLRDILGTDRLLPHAVVPARSQAPAQASAQAPAQASAPAQSQPHAAAPAAHSTSRPGCRPRHPRSRKGTRTRTRNGRRSLPVRTPAPGPPARSRTPLRTRPRHHRRTRPRRRNHRPTTPPTTPPTTSTPPTARTRPDEPDTERRITLRTSRRTPCARSCGTPSAGTPCGARS
ncbi:hypothetical protein ACVV2G_06910 [Streptomyces ziwulingensis]